MAAIAIDMTPVLPGGANGGAKILALELVRRFVSAAPENRYILLTASWNHEELGRIVAEGVTRHLAVKGPIVEPYTRPRSLAGNLLLSFRRRLHRAREKLIWYSGLKRTLSAIQADLLFCPFTVPAQAEKGIPVVCVVHDLQHLEHPQFFDIGQMIYRTDCLRDVVRVADKIVCVSDFVRSSLHRRLRISPDRTETVYNCIQDRFARFAEDNPERHIKGLGIWKRPYIFYPANFWPHKNHRMLITAYNILVRKYPETQLDLVLTGELQVLQGELREAARNLGLERRIHFLGFLPEDQLAAVWKGCDFLAYPSIYEGFGMPLLEAMVFRKPVVCSDAGSIPEICGEAGLYFDPRKPEEIASAFRRISLRSDVRSRLIHGGSERLKRFNPEEMVKKYLKLFDCLSS